MPSCFTSLCVAADATFGSGGKIPSGVIGRAFAIAVRADGKIVLGGVARNNVDRYGLVRVLP